MRVYHQLVFDEVIEGVGINFYTDGGLNSQLGATEAVEIFALSDTVTGTTTLFVQLEHSPDGVNWSNRNSVPEINGVVLSTSANTTWVARDPGNSLCSGFSRLRVALGGAGTPKAHVRIWVAGFKQAVPTPLDILGPSVLQWVRADLGVSLSGSAVTGWTDQSGCGSIRADEARISRALA